MKVSIVVPFLSLVILYLTSQTGRAQSEPDTTVMYRIETFNGNEYSGYIIREDSAKVFLREQEIGDISIQKKEIKHFDRIDTSNLVQGEFWFANPQSGRYFWAPNGYGLKAGEGYYQNVWVLYNQASYGLTNYLSIGAGMIPLVFFAGASTPAWIVPKVSIPVKKEKFNLGAGAIAGTVIGEDKAGFGILYGVATLGNRNNNFNFGLGYGYAGGEWAKRPIINMSAMIRTGSRGYLVTENYFIKTQDFNVTLLSFGGRTIIRRAAGIDYGLILPLSSDVDEFVILPWLGFTVPFGTKPKSGQIPVR